MRRFLLLAVLPACSGPVPVFWLDARSDTQHRGSFDRIEEACEFWGLQCYESDDAFRLNHRADHANVMQADMDVAGDDTTEWQHDKVHRNAARLPRCMD